MAASAVANIFKIPDLRKRIFFTIFVSSLDLRGIRDNCTLFSCGKSLITSRGAVKSQNLLSDLREAVLLKLQESLNLILRGNLE